MNDRLKKIADYLEKNQTATLAQLSDLNGVSLDTVRRDLVLLENEGVLRKVRGGAVWCTVDVTAPLAGLPEIVHRDEKQKIATLLGPYIKDGMAIALSGGTTCTEVATFLAKNYYRLMILTNNLLALEALSEASTFTVILPGGIVDMNTNELFGRQCEERIANYNLDFAILGAYAVSAEKGISDDRFYQGNILLSMIQASRKKILVVDSSKFKKTACINICPMEKMDMVISDSDLPLPVRQQLTQRGLKVITPDDAHAANDAE